QILLNGDPRIILAAGRGSMDDPENLSSVDVMPWMMKPAEDSLVASQLFSILSSPPQLDRPSLPTGTPADIAGAWEVEMDFLVSPVTHFLLLEQEGNQLRGIHQGELLSGKLKGTIHGDQVQFRSSQAYEGTRLGFSFSGKVTAQSMTGSVDLGEYGEAKWVARRVSYTG
ncbi:MAG: Cys/Met metabolism pyridoxal-phosphate-dependent protein, partial [Acidobacteriota bacterium]